MAGKASSTNLIITFVGIIAVIAVVYFLFFKEDTTSVLKIDNGKSTSFSIGEDGASFSTED